MNAARRMEAWALLIGLALVIGGGVGAPATVEAQSGSYAIDWYTIDGGGGSSSAGTLTLNGTIGQADAGVHAGGSYAVAGGFWAALDASYPGYLPLMLR